MGLNRLLVLEPDAVLLLLLVLLRGGMRVDRDVRGGGGSGWLGTLTLA
jgi:hypothetical protein